MSTVLHCKEGRGRVLFSFFWSKSFPLNKVKQTKRELQCAGYSDHLCTPCTVSTQRVKTSMRICNGVHQEIE